MIILLKLFLFERERSLPSDEALDSLAYVENLSVSCFLCSALSRFIRHFILNMTEITKKVIFLPDFFCSSQLKLEESDRVCVKEMALEEDERRKKNTNKQEITSYSERQ